MFTRDRKLTIKNLIVIIISFKSSIQRELDRFYRVVTSSDFNIREVTKGAFTQARAKLSPWAFKRLNQVTEETFYDEAQCYGWHGMRTLAVDGSRLMLPNHPSIIKEFGQQQFGPKADSPRSIAMVSLLYDTINLVTLDSIMAPYTSSERDLLVGHLEKMKAGDLLLLDRGYPCFWVLFLLAAKGIEFCIRMQEDWWVSVKKFKESDQREQLVTFALPKKDRGRLADFPHMHNSSLTCRLIKIDLEDGNKEILCTSLTDAEQYPHEDFKELYHCRWQEEEAYKLLKSRVELENFSGKTALAVQQDFHAKVFLMTLCAAYAHPIEEKVRNEYQADEERKRDQQINHTNALAMTQDILIGVFLKHKYKKAMEAFDRIVSGTREIIRPDRSMPRNHRRKKLYYMNYKRL